MALDASGNILVAGQINIGTNQLYVARLASDGSQDTNFSIGEINGAVTQIGIEPNGEIVVTGSFSEINGYSRVGIAELLSDGQVDTSFRPNPDTNYGTLLAIEADGQILTTGNGKLMRVNPDGSVDTTFNPNVSAVQCLTIQPDGRLLIGGSFSQVNRTNVNGIARLQGDSLTPFQTQLLNINFYAGMQINGNVGTSYRVESATNLDQSLPWTPLSTFSLTTTLYWFLDTNPISSGASRFYRAVILPP